MTEPSLDLYRPFPLLLVISGPSGVGKDTVVRALQQSKWPLHFVVTATTRPPRPEECDGVDYHFWTRSKFEEMVARDEMFEHALVYNQYKGVPKSQIRGAFETGKDVIMRVDVQGAGYIRQKCPQAVLIFLSPSNKEELVQRIRSRATDTEEQFRLRMEMAVRELESVSIFDYVVINAQNRVDDAVETIQSIIEAEHHRVDHRRVQI
jgi:guanylate kinase